MKLFKKQKKGDIGFGVMALLIIGLLLIVVLIIIAAKSKGSFSNMFSSLGNLLG